MRSASICRPAWYCACASSAQRRSRRGAASTIAAACASTSAWWPAASAASTASSSSSRRTSSRRWASDTPGSHASSSVRGRPRQRSRAWPATYRACSLSPEREQLAGPARRPRELDRVDRVGGHAEPVAVRETVSIASGPEQLAQPADAALQVLRPGGRWFVPPHGVGELFRRAQLPGTAWPALRGRSGHASRAAHCLHRAPADPGVRSAPLDCRPGPHPRQGSRYRRDTGRAGPAIPAGCTTDATPRRPPPRVKENDHEHHPPPPDPPEPLVVRRRGRPRRRRARADPRDAAFTGTGSGSPGPSTNIDTGRTGYHGNVGPNPYVCRAGHPVPNMELPGCVSPVR